MEVNGDLLKGHISTVILKSLQDGDKYGYEIAKIIESNSQGKFVIKQPTLYSTLKRLQSQGLISSYWLDSEIGGRRHYYKLTEQGYKQIENSQDQWNISRLVIDSMVTDSPSANANDDEILEQPKKDIENTSTSIKTEIKEKIASPTNKEVEQENKIVEAPPASLFEFAERLKSEQESKEKTEGELKIKAEKEQVTNLKEEEHGNLKEIELRKLTQIHYNEPDIKKPLYNGENKSYFEKEHALSKNDFKFNITAPAQSEEFIGDFTLDDKVISTDLNDTEKTNDNFNFDDLKDIIKQSNEYSEPVKVATADNVKPAIITPPTQVTEKQTNTFANFSSNNTQENMPKSYYPIKSFIYPDDYGKAKTPKQKFDIANNTVKESLKNEEELPQTYSEVDYKGILGDLYAPINFKFSEKTNKSSDIVQPEDIKDEQTAIEEPSIKIEETAKPKSKPMFDATIKEYFSTSKKQSQQEQKDDIKEVKEERIKKSNVKFNSYNKKTDTEFNYNYVLQNKLKFVQSIMMFVVMMLIIAGSYILLDYYDMLASNSNTLFVLAVLFACCLPFVSLIAYLANPDKKTSTTFNFSLNLFIKIIATLATLVFIYAFNLFLGMTDLNQVEYYANWLVPSLLSSSYIISTFVYALLVKSKKYSL